MHEGNLFGPKHHRLRCKVFYLYYSNNPNNLQFFFFLQIGEFNNQDETLSISTSKVTYAEKKKGRRSHCINFQRV